MSEVPVAQSKAADLSYDSVLSALKGALTDKFDSDRINTAITQLGNERGWFDSVRVLVKKPEDLLSLEWGDRLSDAGLRLTHEDLNQVLRSAVSSIQLRSVSQDILTSQAALEPSGSALDLVSEEEVMKIIEELKVEDETLEDTLSEDTSEPKSLQ